MAEFSYFHLGERDEPGRPTRDRSLDTFGGRIMSEPETGRFDYEVEAFYQTGSVSASLASGSPRQSVAASRSEEHTSELQSLMRISYAVFCLKKKKDTNCC